MNNKKDLLREIGVRLQSARIKAGFTQEKAAEKLKISKNMYGNYEVGKSSIPYANLLELCNLFYTSPDIILGYEDSARINLICDKYDIRYKNIDNRNVAVTTNNGDFKILKSVFWEILFKCERMINHVALQSEHLKELRQYESDLIKTFIDYEIYFADKGKYKPAQMLKDLKKIIVEEINEEEDNEKRQKNKEYMKINAEKFKAAENTVIITTPANENEGGKKQ